MGKIWSFAQVKAWVCSVGDTSHGNTQARGRSWKGSKESFMRKTGWMPEQFLASWRKERNQNMVMEIFDDVVVFREVFPRHKGLLFQAQAVGTGRQPPLEPKTKKETDPQSPCPPPNFAQKSAQHASSLRIPPKKMEPIVRRVDASVQTGRTADVHPKRLQDLARIHNEMQGIVLCRQSSKTQQAESHSPSFLPEDPKIDERKGEEEEKKKEEKEKEKEKEKRCRFLSYSPWTHPFLLHTTTGRSLRLSTCLR